MIVDDSNYIYITSIYYTITTFTQIGYGDFHAYTKDEHLYVMILIFIAIALYGYMLGTLSNILQDINQNSEQEREE